MLLLIFAQLLQICQSKQILRNTRHSLRSSLGENQGICGPNLNWTYEDTVLTIFGEGEMTDFTTETMPWKEYSSEITKVIIQNGCTTIGSLAFTGLAQMEQIEIAGTVTFIGTGAFKNCSKLTSFPIPENLNSTCDDSFVLMTSLTSFVVPQTNQFYKAKDGILFNFAGTELIQYPIGKTEAEYSIAETVTKIAKNAFKYSKLQSIQIPNTVTEILSYAFAECTELTQITLPENLLTISDYLLFDCANLKTLKLSSNLEIIGKSSFSMCKSLTSLELPGSIQSIGQNAFFSNINLAYLKFNGKQDPTHGSLVFDNCPLLTSIDVNSDYVDQTFCGIPVNSPTQSLSPSITPSSLPTLTPEPDSGDKKIIKAALISGIVILSVVIAILIGLIILVLFQRHSNGESVLLSTLLVSPKLDDETKL